MRWIPWLVFALVLVGAAGFILNTVDLLPLQVATHFGRSQRANGSMTRGFYLLFILGFAVLLPLVVAGSIALVPRVAARSLLRWANRQPLQRQRDAALRVLSTQAPWLGCIMAAFAAGLHATLVRANEVVPPQLPTDLFVALMVAFFALLLVWIVTFMVRVRRAF
jgi:hypothetical protein